MTIDREQFVFDRTCDPRLGPVIDSALDLVYAIDQIIDNTSESLDRGYVDWGMCRFSTVIAGANYSWSGLVSAMIVRSLIEEAAQLDWAISMGLIDHALAINGAVELQRLRAEGITPAWILPPGTELVIPESSKWLRDPGDHLDRIGDDPSLPSLSPLKIPGLKNVRALLDAFGHVNPTAILCLHASGGFEMPTPLTACGLHLGGVALAALASATFAVDSSTGEQLTELTSELAEAAAEVHGLSASTAAPTPSYGQQRTRLIGKSQPVAAMYATALVSQMEEVDNTSVEHVADFLRHYQECVQHLGEVPSADAYIMSLAQSSVGLTVACFQIVEGAFERTASWHNIPFAARAVLELGARWGWCRSQIENDFDVQSAMKSVGIDQINKMYDRLASDGIDEAVLTEILGTASQYRDVQPRTDAELPNLAVMLREGFSPYGTAFATNAYSLLSQFTHATTLGYLHGTPGEHGPVPSGPMLSVALTSLAMGGLEMLLLPMRFAYGLRMNVEPNDTYANFHQQGVELAFTAMRSAVVASGLRLA